MKNVLDVLNWNKEEKFSCNTVIMYCWNEYSEGGWFCPTIAVDENGKVLGTSTPKAGPCNITTTTGDIDIQLS